MYPFAFEETANIRRTTDILPHQTALAGVVYSTGTVGLEAILSGLPTLRFLPEGIVATEILPPGLSPPVADAENFAAALAEFGGAPPCDRNSVIAPVDLSVWRQYLLAT